MIAAHSSPVSDSVTPPRIITPPRTPPGEDDQPSKKVRVYNGKCTTYSEIKKFNFTWTVEDFSTWLSRNENSRFSPDFPANDAEIKWNLEFCRESKTDKSFSSLYLNLKQFPDKHVNATFKLSMKDANQIVFRQIIKDSAHFSVGKGWGFANFVERDTLIQKMKADNTLIIGVKIYVKDRIVDKLTETTTVEPDSPGSSLTQDIATLLESKKFGDVSIKIGNRKILAHKNILSSRSSVFAAMFEHKMKERITNLVTITDIKPNVFDELLRYVYTDKVNNLPALSHQLYAAADKYDIQGLKTLCRIAIVGNMTPENVSETLICADLHDDQDMKSRALQLMSSNRNAALEVIKSSGWKELLKTHPHVVNAAFEVMANKM